MILNESKLLKYALIILLAIFSDCKSFAVSDIQESRYKELQTIYPKIPDKNLKDVIEENKTKNNLSDDKTITDKKRQNPLNLFRSCGYQFEKGPVKNQKISFFTHGGLILAAQRGESFYDHMDYAANEITIETNFADNKTKFAAGYNFTRTREYNNNLWAKFSYVELWHRFNKNQEIVIGETRIPNGYEGGMSSSLIHFLPRSQIARHFGNSITNAIRNIGNYKYLEYDVALSDGSRYWQQVLGGGEITALASVKPLAKYDNKYGSLRVGGSIDHGRSHDMGFTVVGGHLLYNYKKFFWDTEYQYANNYAGVWYHRGRAHGLYSAVGYFITPKIELLARYDFFQNLENYNISTEYTAGISYYVAPRAKLMLNYILATNDEKSAPAHRIYMGADIKVYSLVDKIFEHL